MRNPFPRGTALLLCLAALPALSAAPPPVVVVPPTLPAALTEAELAARIDRLVEARLKERNVSPAPLTDDAAFIRRAYLDLAGRVPNILEVRDFLDDDRPDKRRIWVDQLLRGVRKGDTGDTYSDHFAALWRSWLVPNLDPEQGGPYLGYQFEAWLRKQLRDNVPYDRLARDVLTTSLTDASVAAFFQANGNTPEGAAAAVARQLLGVRLECAQCHDDRSGGSWAREQFWELAAFFRDVGGGQPAGPEPQIAIPNTKTVVKARFLDGGRPTFRPGVSPRATLADWVTAPANPLFARAAANRVWAHLLGTGLVEPADEFGDHNPPSHPDVLDELARQLIAHKYDLKYLIRSVVLTRAYQRSSRATQPAQDDLRLFARAAVRGLSAEQIFDSVAEVGEYRDAGPEVPQPFGDGRRTPRQEFIERFRNHDKRTESETTILQALHLMNGAFLAQVTSPDQNRTLATIADAARIDTVRRLETLYLVALTRKPTEAELKRLVPYVERGGPSGSPRKALADVFWALLNSAEFLLNH